MRLVITGLPGAGKTSLAKSLARRYGVPHIEADTLFWQSPAAFQRQVERLTLQDSWIYEGHLSKVFDTVSHRAELWVELNPGASRCYARMIRRELAACWSSPSTRPLKRCLYNTVYWGMLVRNQRRIHRCVKDLPHLSR